MSVEVVGDHILGHMVEVRIGNDPFTTYTDHRQLTRKRGKHKTMAKDTKTRTAAKQLRQEAKQAGIEGWEEMTREELESALGDTAGADTTTKARRARTRGSEKATKKAATRPAKAARPAKKAAAASNGDNPYRSGTNLYLVTEALKRGGKRSDLVDKLRSKMSFAPRDGRDVDADAEIDRRLKVVGYLLKNQHGWEMEHTGRGPDAYIRVRPPA